MHGPRQGILPVLADGQIPFQTIGNEFCRIAGEKGLHRHGTTSVRVFRVLDSRYCCSRMVCHVKKTTNLAQRSAPTVGAHILVFFS